MCNYKYMKAGIDFWNLADRPTSDDHALLKEVAKMKFRIPFHSGVPEISILFIYLFKGY